MSTHKLTPKQQAFVDAYLIEPNATQAALKAGYAKNAAQQTGSENLLKPVIVAAIGKARAKRAERTKIDADYVLNRHYEIDQMDILDILGDNGGIKPIKEWPKVWRITLSGYDIMQLSNADDLEVTVKKIKWPDKVRNLELLGKHNQINAYQEVVAHKVLMSDKTDSELLTDLNKILGRSSGESITTH